MSSESERYSPREYAASFGDRSTPFPYEEVEGAVDGVRLDPREEARAAAIDVFCKFLPWLAGRSLKRERLSSSTVGLRAIAALWVIKPELFGGISLNELSHRVDLGVTDTILSRYASEFRDTYDFKGRSQRSDGTRAKMRAALRRPVFRKIGDANVGGTTP